MWSCIKAHLTYTCTKLIMHTYVSLWIEKLAPFTIGTKQESATAAGEVSYRARHRPWEGPGDEEGRVVLLAENRAIGCRSHDQYLQHSGLACYNVIVSVKQ